MDADTGAVARAGRIAVPLASRCYTRDIRNRTLKAYKAAPSPAGRHMQVTKLTLAKPPSVLNKTTVTRAPETVAAIDLGSNSFHMIVARALNGQLHVLDRLQEMVRLAAGLDERHRLEKEAQRRALACLERFGQRLHGIRRDSVRVVGTDTLRRARNVPKFLAAAERALGHPIEIISGQEEARLIYQGVARNLPDDAKNRLVVDIGGGSTEFIIGKQLEPVHMESLHMGCVGLSLKYFPRGTITRKRLEQAETAARLELQPVQAEFCRIGWEAAYGASGTVRAIGAIVRAQGWDEQGITRDALYRLREIILSAGSSYRLKLPGLPEERAPVFPGGLVIMLAAFEALHIERLLVSDGALREGLLYDLLGRIRQQDVRSRTIGSLSNRYHVDIAQAVRVERTARYCCAQMSATWKLLEDDIHALGWATRLHEIGLAIAHTKYHKHGAYLVRHSDLPGFSLQEQWLLAALIRGHRRRFPRELFEELKGRQFRKAVRLCLLLRLAVLLHRARAEIELPLFELMGRSRGLSVRFPRGWLKKNPLTRADLEQEARYLRAAGLRLDFA